MIEIRGDFKQVHKGIMQKVYFLGAERKISYILISFCFLGNLFLMWSLWQIPLIIITLIGFAISRYLFLKDPEILTMFFDNFTFEIKKNKYLLPSSNILDINKKSKKVY